MGHKRYKRAIDVTIEGTYFKKADRIEERWWIEFFRQRESGKKTNRWDATPTAKLLGNVEKALA